ncbi:MAG: DUF433 domain-containing protein [Nitrospirales bacterium]|nr:DUF433 domain-containing protein [Nitrospira sp.]MDR4499877.1 DUF433 domain-containing protein [Nitrospirales bacterium]
MDSKKGYLVVLVSQWSVRYPHSMSNDELLTRITIDPQVCHGKPCIRSLRYPVEWILELMSSGMTTEQILTDYEDLEEADLRAACAFAARLSQIQRIEPVVGKNFCSTPNFPEDSPSLFNLLATIVVML